MFLFFSAFFLAGVGFSIPILILPIWRMVEAQSWQPAQCTIESASVETHPSDEGGATYSIAVQYVYDFGGTAYHGDRYDFSIGSTSGYDGKHAKVLELPAGKRTGCWVDPEDPTRSVLVRRPGWAMLFGCLPLVFVGVGGAGMTWAARSALGERRRRRRGRAGARVELRAPAGTPVLALGNTTDGPSVSLRAGAAEDPAEPAWLPQPAGEGVGGRGSLRLEPKHGPVGRLIGSLLVALFWNGIVSVFLWKAAEGWRSGSPDGCLTLFLVPFVLVGLALLVNVPYQILALFNPRPVVTLSEARVPVGGSVRLHWEFSGAATRLRSLRIWAEGKEHATYRRGTDTHTESHTFARVTVVDLPGGATLGTGEATLAIPAGTMHSFAGDRNKIVWTLRLHGPISRWPDVSEELELVVEPGAMQPSAVETEESGR